MYWFKFTFMVMVMQTEVALACQSGYTPCQPAGATGTALPPVGTGLASLYTDLLSSIGGIKAPADHVEGHGMNVVARDDPQICCMASDQRRRIN